MSAATILAGPQQAATIASLVGGTGVQLLEQVLPAYLPQQRWFGGKSRAIAASRLHSAKTLPGTEYVLTMIDVTYADGSEERYQLPLAIATGNRADDLLSLLNRAAAESPDDARPLSCACAHECPRAPGTPEFGIPRPP